MSPVTPPDLEKYSFTEEGPWVVEPDEMPWRRGTGTLRLSTRRQVPFLTTPRRLPGTRVFRVSWKMGKAVAGWRLIDKRKGSSESLTGISRRLRIAAEQLGPTYIKLGQILSAGDGLFPAELVAEFKKCRDQVPAERWEVVKAVVEEELGKPLNEVFAEFDHTPLAAASIAQVHRAVLTTGESVVVKVQRPTVSTQVRQDLRVMAWMAPKMVGRIPVSALANPPALVELFAETITEELDFRLEAENMLDVAATFASLGQRGYVVPRPHPTLVTRRVLVMERLVGFNFDDVLGMQNADVDTTAVVRTGMIGFLEGTMIHGIFHGDLHGGNLLVLPDGRIGLLDYGITARMTPAERGAFVRLIMGATMGDLKSQLTAMRDLGALPADANIGEVMSELGLDQGFVDPTTLTQDELVAQLQKVVQALLGYGAKLPKILMLYVKNLVFLDGAIATLAPTLDLLEEITQLSIYFAQTHGEQLANDMGFDPRETTVDIDALKQSLGFDPSVAGGLTYEDLRKRRALIQSRFQKN